MLHLPPTPAETLDRARQIALSTGLPFVYISNLLVEDAQNTRCPQCRRMLVQRTGRVIIENHVRNGKCPDCRTEIYGIWE